MHGKRTYLLNINIPICSKNEIKVLTVCTEVNEDLDLDWTMPNVELVQAISICYNVQ